MLQESVKRRIVKSLVDEIAGLDPLHLELCGHGLLEILEGQKLVHHGINKDYKFVGYTVDTFSNDSMVVGQYSTEEGYFENDGTKDKPRFKKIEKDIQSAEKHRKPKRTTRIYLLSTQEEPPSFRAKFNQTDVANRLRGELTILDAREQAKRIYELSIANPHAASFFRSFFAGFSQDLDNFEYYGKLPAQCDNHQSDTGIIAAIRQHFAAGENIAVLHGVSGSGKTQAAIDFVHHEADTFENYVWLAGGDWHPDTPLTAVQRARGGAAINVVGLFNSAKTILVIDKLDQDLEVSALKELAPGFAKGGVVLVTSQVASPGVSRHLPMPTFSKEVAIRILGEDPSKASTTCERFVAACRFSPLLLSAARKIIDSQNLPSDAFYEGILAAPEALDSDDGTSIMRRMLERLDEPLREALGKIAKSGSSTHDGAFLIHYLGAVPRVRLQRLAILTAARSPGVMSVHDLICKAMRIDVDSHALTVAIETYIDSCQGEMTPSVLRQIHISRSQLLAEHEQRGEREPDWLVYALLQISDTKQEVFQAYVDRKIDRTVGLAALMCLIDAREQHAYSIADNEERQAFYVRSIEEYKEALATANGRAKSELLHHLGKAYRRTGRADEALKCFKQLLELEPEWHAAHGQIAHLGAQRGTDAAIKAEGEKSLRFLIDQITADAYAVPLRVSMAALSILRSYYNLVRELIDDPSTVEVLAEVIAMSALEGLDQFYDAFVAFTSKFGYQYQQISINLAETASEMFSVSPDLIGREQQKSACEALANVAQAARRSGNESLSRRLSELSCKCADVILASGKINSYEARGIAKAFTIAGEPSRALEVIDRVPAGEINHWLLYRKAEAQLALGLPEALKTAEEAMAQALVDKKAQRQISPYYDLLSRCFEYFGDLPAAFKNTEIALKHSEDGKYRRALEERLEKLRQAMA